MSKNLIAYFSRKGFNYSKGQIVFLETGNTDRICALLEQDLGVSFLPDYVTDQAVAEGRLVRLPVKGFAVDVWQQLLYHRNKWISPQIKAVMEHCVQTMFAGGNPDSPLRSAPK